MEHALQLLLLTLTNAFIVLMVFIFWSWNLPDDAFLKRLVNRLSVPLVWLGLAHNWRMFAPTPVSGNQRAHFEAVLSDGSVQSIDNLSFFGPPATPFAMCNNRHLRIQHSLLTPGASAIKPAFCKYVLSMVEAQQPVVEVRIVAVKRAASPPGASSATEVTRAVVYRYRVPPATHQVAPAAVVARRIPAT
jgi:hypothetical protein